MSHNEPRGSSSFDAAWFGGASLMVASYSPIPVDPVLMRLGPVEIRWYGIMYVLATICCTIIGRWELRRKGGPIPEHLWAEMLFYTLVGILLGGRLGHVILYDFGYFVKNPLEIFATWQGGMSFHGGLAGVVIAGLFLARKRRLPFMELADVASLTAPIGIMFVKIGNFINGELYGRVTSVPWGMVFPLGSDVPRHPSQLYEAFFEGPVLFMILWRIRFKAKAPGEIFGLFLLGYGVFRFAIEFFREPDATGFVLWGMTMGQVLCMCMIGAGAVILAFSRIFSENTNQGPAK